MQRERNDDGLDDEEDDGRGNRGVDQGHRNAVDLGHDAGVLAEFVDGDVSEHTGEDRAGPVGQESAVVGEVGEARLVGVHAGQHAEDGQQADDDERADRDDIDPGEPELELAVGAHRYEVRGGQHHHHDERPAPLRYGRYPPFEDLGAGGRLHGEHDDPEEPVQPADRETGRAAQFRSADIRRAHTRMRPWRTLGASGRSRHRIPPTDAWD